ncbi:MAG: metallophosphoesterase [Candidatus Diapherotrites archaeon]|nr:metallophosphoesterase [Candidatus Diapherotrites archaeon]
MKLAIISDMHLGYGWETEREQDSFKSAEEAFKIALDNKVAGILLAGDIFDTKIPKPEVWEKTLKLFKPLKKANYEHARVKDHEFKSIPVISIHGTHELRSKDYKNPIEILDAGGFLVHLHLKSACLIDGDEEVHIYGMSGIPEKYAKAVLAQWEPKPVHGKQNIIMFHQTFKEFLPVDSGDEAWMGLDDLPEGFDLYINGHLHWKRDVKLSSGKPFLLTGSTITTQMKKLEAEVPKGVHIYDTKTKKLEFIPLESTRELFYKKIVLDDATKDKVSQEMRSFIEESLYNKKKNTKPLIRIRLQGSLAKGVKNSDIDINLIIAPYGDKAIFSISKELVSKSLKEKIDLAKRKKLSHETIEEEGMKILEEILKETGLSDKFDTRRMFKLVSEKDTETAWDTILEELKEN